MEQEIDSHRKLARDMVQLATQHKKQAQKAMVSLRRTPSFAESLLADLLSTTAQTNAP